MGTHGVRLAKLVKLESQTFNDAKASTLGNKQKSASFASLTP